MTSLLKNVTLNVQSENDVCINGSERLLHDIIYNLCDNAIKYNKQDGKVDVFVKNEETGK